MFFRKELKWPRISIVTPSLNQAEFLEETICSVLSQEYPNLEYIIIDGGSNDGSTDIIKRYASRLRHWVSERDRGQSHAINKGFVQATGSIYGFLNSDDLLNPGALFAVARAFASIRDRMSIISFAGVHFDATGDLRRYDPPKTPSLLKWLDTTSSLFQPATFWTSDLYKSIGGFREDLTYLFDKDFFLKAVFINGMYSAFPDKVVAKFRIHPHSKTSTLHQVMLRENDLLARHFREDPRLGTRLYNEKRRRESLKFVESSFVEESRWRAALLLMKSLRTDPSIAGSRFYLGAWRKLFNLVRNHG
jgi:glycosyltransferase involved in cell wall biosynthesis